NTLCESLPRSEFPADGEQFMIEGIEPPARSRIAEQLFALLTGDRIGLAEECHRVRAPPRSGHRGSRAPPLRRAKRKNVCSPSRPKSSYSVNASASRRRSPSSAATVFRYSSGGSTTARTA